MEASHSLECEDCNFSFKTESSINAHIKLCSLKVLPDAPLDTCECEQFGSIFINQFKLEQHLLGHDAFNGRIEKTPYRKCENKCDQCPYKGQSESDLEDHI